ncbi:ABC transporter substrate-binding protein [Natronorubrum sulfidifaciens]|uniref:ABC transporter periplasmic protein n=1 Tax=Natronorubrum sulfidifaciens JCM 14089 TaxID=1230460 RepID=L9W4L6_9EURY|nr:ABC transporter substrate-binding protein [Natronorubrum sulfidifaciens]ELY44395.1 ABC transporter periplasmic protein [Natronorubrum sulfidifaciens JCM 14089]
MLALLGGSASVGLAGCSALLSEEDEDEDETSEYEVSDNADKAQAAWERVLANTAPEDEAIRTDAYIEIEEAVRDDMVLLPLFHNQEERFWYDHVDVPKTGSLGAHHQQHNHTDVDGDTELNLINSTFSELDPIMSTDTASGVVVNQIYETLTQFPNGVAELENQLLEGVETSDDGLTWTFTIRDDVQFHNGEDLTADDFKYSFRRVAESEYSERANFLLETPLGLGIEYEEDDDGGVVPDSIAFEVIDDHTFEITLREPNPAVLDILAYSAFAAIPEGYVGDIEGYDGEVDHQEFETDVANGTGPFELDEFELNEEVRVVRNDNYYGTVATLESVHWEINEDPESGFTYAMERNADIFGIPTAQYDPDLIDAETDDSGRESGTYGPLENGDTVNYLAIPELSTFYLAFNVSNVPRAVRQAVAYVTDHEEVIEDLFQGRGFKAYSFTPSGMWPSGQDGYESWVDEWPYGVDETDRDGARDVLEEAGFTDDDPYELTASTYASEPAFGEFAELTRQKLSGLGVEVSNQETEFATMQNRAEDGDVEMYSLGWIWSWPNVTYGHFALEPKNTDTSRMPNEATGFYLDWHVNLEDEA